MFPNWSQNQEAARDARDQEIVDTLRAKLNDLLDDDEADASEIERVCNNLASHGAISRAG